MAIFYSPRRRETFPPKFHLIPPKYHLSPTWKIFFSSVDNSDLLRSYCGVRAVLEGGRSDRTNRRGAFPENFPALENVVEGVV